MSQAALHPMLNIAIKAARAAGAIINRASLDVERLTVSAKSHNDFVTEVDQAAEEAIIDTILAAYPSHGILAEESGQSRGNKTSEFVWIIDPLDGTTNFIHGFPVYAVSIALAWRGQVQQAVVYDPSRNDLFYASRGKGAYMNDRRLRVSKRTRMLDSLIGTGFPFRKGDNFQRYLKMFEEVMVQCAGVRRPGAAALDLCYVAAGFYDGFFETGLSPWDIAAGSLMITEAGGLVGNFTGEADFLYQREVVAGNPRIYGQLVQTLSPYTRVIKDEPKDTSGLGASAAGIGSYEDTAEEEADAALQAVKEAEEAAQAAAPKPVVRKRITAAAKAAEVASEQASEPPARRRSSRSDDAPF
ncbi:MAG TPA: inositol monophosphatase [Candidatus Aquabacterium excrementipullorum]|nr:inositol monophosphatase [Candidatus Aquabacterium excrementipullorum]